MYCEIDGQRDSAAQPSAGCRKSAAFNLSAFAFENIAVRPIYDELLDKSLPHP
jgi:hypothetical protein